MILQPGILARLSFCDALRTIKAMKSSPDIREVDVLLSLFESKAPSDNKPAVPKATKIVSSAKPPSSKSQPRSAEFSGKPGPVPKASKKRMTLERTNFLERATNFFERQRAIRGDNTRWAPYGKSVRPIHFPLIQPDVFRTVVGALGRQRRNSGSIDVKALVNAVSIRKPITDIPRKVRLSLGEGLTIIGDKGLGMMCFQPDMNDFIHRAHARIGRASVKIGWINETGRLGRFSIPQQGTVILLSDLQAFARRNSYDHTRYDEWVELLSRIAAKKSHFLVLSPGGPENKVPAPGFPDIFGRRAPARIRVIPWDSSLTPRRADRFANQQGKVRFRQADIDHSINLNTGHIDRPSLLLLRLMTLTHDLDFYTLRALRLVLSDPQSVITGYSEDIDNSFKAWEGCQKLSPCAPNTSAFHEHSVWISDFIFHRGETSTFSTQFDRFRKSQFLQKTNNWAHVMAFARETIHRCRAGRGFTELLGDQYHWTMTPDREDPDVASKEREKFQVFSEHLAQADGSSKRLRQVDRGLLGNPKIESESNEHTLPKLTFRREGELLYFGMDMADADIEFLLPLGTDLREAILELWEVDGAEEPALTCALWPLGQALDLSKTDEREALRTIVVTINEQQEMMNLNANLTSMTPLFSRNITTDPASKGDLHFDGENIIYCGQRYDAKGLRLIDSVPDVIEPDFNVPEEVSKTHESTNASWEDNYGSIFVQRDIKHSKVEAIHLPGKKGKYVSGMVGHINHVVFQTPERIWFIGGGGESVIIRKWESKSQPHKKTKVKLFASSLVCGVLEEFDSHSSRINLLADETRDQVISGTLPCAIDEIAMCDEGLIVVRNKNNLAVYERMETLGSGEESSIAGVHQSATSATRPDIQVEFLDHYSRNWHPTDRHYAHEMIDALNSVDTDNASRVFQALRKWKDKPSISDLSAGLDIPMSEAAMIDAISRGDAEGLEQAVDEGANVNVVCGNANLSALYIACLHLQPVKLVEILIQHGADTNARDNFGRTPIYCAGFADDNGDTVRLLLENNADPSLNGKIKGVPIGSLPTALYRRENLTAVEEESWFDTIKMLMGKGADPLAFGSSDMRSSLINVASHSDLVLFNLVLAHDNRVDHIDNSGWSPLLMAAYCGNSEVIKVLIEAGANPNLQIEGLDAALFMAIRRLKYDCVNVLLDMGALPDIVKQNSGERVSSLNVLLTSSEKEASKSAITDIAHSLAIAGAETDAAPWPFKPLLMRWFFNDDKINAVAVGFIRAGKRIRIIETMRHIIDEEQTSIKLESLGRVPLNAIDFDTPNSDGLSLLHILATIDGPNAHTFFQRVIDHGVDLEVIDSQGANCLHYACAAGQVEIAGEILANNPGLQDQRRSDGMVPADIAKAYGHRDVLQVINDKRESPKRFQSAITAAPATLARLSYLPLDTDWNIVKVRTERRPAGLGSRTLLPLPISAGVWTTMMAREARLPYAVEYFLREIWWRRDDDVVGVTAEVRKGNRHLAFITSGHSAPIHELNHQHMPKLDNELAVYQYLKFFCHSVHGGEGAFAICDSERSLQRHIGKCWPETQALPVPEINNLKGADKDNWGEVSAVVRYSDSIFIARFNIKRNGLVEMLDDSPFGTMSSEGLEVFQSDGNIFYYAPKPDELP